MIYNWILISVLLQTAVLAYVNYVYLPGRGAFRATAYNDEAPGVKNRSFKLPEGASGISVSFDGLYAAYRLGDSLEIADIDRKKTVKRLSPAGGEFTYFRWLPDREMLIYSIREPEGKDGRVRISTYDIGPELDRSYPDIKNLPENSAIVDIELSPLTNIVYPKIQTSDTRARIYKFDIMDNLRLIMKTDLDTVITETMYSDNLIYQPAGKKILVRNGKSGKTSNIPVKEANKLLAVDDRDYIYAAATDDDGMLTAVYYGKLGQKPDEWQWVSPGSPESAEDLFITPEGGIYIADGQDKTVRALKGSGTTKYQGELIAVTDSYAVSLDGNKLLFRVLEK